MSHFIALTKHPKTKKWKKAYWMDNWFGAHQYGVKFENEDEIFDPSKVEGGIRLSPELITFNHFMDG